MNKTELVSQVAQKAEISKKDAERAVTAVIETIIGEVTQGNKVQITGFGTFEQRIRKERKGTIPKTKKEIIIPETKTPAFKPGKSFKDSVNK